MLVEPYETLIQNPISFNYDLNQPSQNPPNPSPGSPVPLEEASAARTVVAPGPSASLALAALGSGVSGLSVVGIGA